MRTLAIDLGTRRIGLALSDAGGRIATPYDVIEVSSPELALAPIEQIVQREGVERIVLGLPLNMDGTMGAQAQSTIEWSRRLKPGAVQVLFVDERLSSFDAEQQLVQRKRLGEKITRKSKRQKLDAIAAASFLQAFLDGKLGAIDVGA